MLLNNLVIVIRCVQTSGMESDTHPQNSSTLSKLITRLISSIQPCAASPPGV